jgi:hemoglobin
MSDASASIPPSSSPVTLRASQDGDTVGFGNFYREIGGAPVFEKLVHEFYRGVADDELLRPMYPEQDLGPAEERLRMFLTQYWGGPKDYQEKRGHPRLRMRHHAFRVTPAARDRWLLHMRAAVDTLGLPPLHEATLWGYLDRAAHSLVNTFDE